MSISNTSLDIYFDQLYEKNLKFCINHAETAVIKAGTEQLVRNILDSVDKAVAKEQDSFITDFLSKYPEHRFVSKGNANGENIIKVGSFYERTKNSYPDEFDYIYIVGTFEVYKDSTDGVYLRQHYFILDDFHERIKEILTSKGNIWQGCLGDAFIVFDGYVRKQGPSSKLKFCYVDPLGNRESIYVDIVPAFKIKDRYVYTKLREVCDIKGFVREVKATGSYLIAEEVSFTATEVMFMRTKLSKTHLKAYRILKFIFNGHRQKELLQAKVNSGGITTYIIKVAMTRHHYLCIKHNVIVSDCVISVLETLQEFCKQCIERNPSKILRKLNGSEFNVSLYKICYTEYHVQNVLIKLELMKVMDFPLSIIPIADLLYCDLEKASSVGGVSRPGSARRKNISLRNIESSLRTTIPPSTKTSMSGIISYDKEDYEWVDTVVSVAYRAVKHYHGKENNETANVRVKNYTSQHIPGNTILDPAFYERPSSNGSMTPSVGSEYQESIEGLSSHGDEDLVYVIDDYIQEEDCISSSSSSGSVCSYNNRQQENPKATTVHSSENLSKSCSCTCIIL